ncbi:toxic anion resistance protein [Clostridium omnivorum]|uniref:Toxic anion resistance protein n=1 Tax=Clostridium omnivorum TaxID=1604902 RepID=A0ABQ5N109_9CLOT|nr:toxic anion resistance protein [Clostridium sp. E14]GLC28871.1 toxic anion resistance protein [Clostridium sp. E14]
MRFAEENKMQALTNEQSGELYNNDFELREKLETIKKELEKSPEVIELSKQVDVKSPNSILQFGSKPAEEISKFSDKILSSIKTSSIESSSVMLQDLSKLMSRFDKEELMDKDRSFLGKLFYNGQKAVEKLLSKYQTLGREIDRIYKQISDYKNELTKTNDMLDEMFVQNIEYYKQLEKYVIACNMVINELETEDLPYYSEKAKSGDPSDALELEAVNNAIEMLKNRAYDFEMAKMVAMQTAPQIRIIQKGNFKLIGKIHSAFIITIPIFKNGLIQAVTLKRQNLVADSMAALDRTTNELLIKNAQNLKNQSIEIAKLSNSSAINIDTLENTWKAIVEGINETKRIEDENRTAREESMKKINNMQIEFMKKIH